MKTCPNCEYPIEENTSICPYCGAEQPNERNNSSEKQTPETPIAVTQSENSINSDEDLTLPLENKLEHPQETNSPIQVSNQSEKEADVSLNEQENVSEEVSDFDLLKPHLKQAQGYFAALMQAIIQPPLMKESSHPWLGSINFGLIALFYALTAAKLVGNLLYGLFSAFGHYGMYFAQETKNLPFFFVFFVSIIVLQLVAVGIYWGFAYSLMSEKLSFKMAFNRIFAPLSLLVPLSLFAFLFALAGGALSILAFGLLLLHFGFIRYSFHGNLWLVDNPKSHNRFYITLVPVCLYVVASFIVLQMLFHMLLNHAQIQEIVQQIFTHY